MLVPVETVTCNRRRIASVAMTYRQVQSHHTVAARSIGKRVGKRIRTGGYIRMLVPVETVASNRRGIARVTMAYRQMQSYYAVAATGIGKRVGKRIRAGGNIRVLVPVETITCNRRRIARI